MLEAQRLELEAAFHEDAGPLGGDEVDGVDDPAGPGEVGRVGLEADPEEGEQESEVGLREASLGGDDLRLVHELDESCPEFRTLGPRGLGPGLVQDRGGLPERQSAGGRVVGRLE